MPIPDIPAFPIVFPERDDALLHAPGMSLRDYFAAKAMHAELSTAGAFDGPAQALAEAAAVAGQTIPERIAVLSYEMADAMMCERAKPR